MKISDLQVKMGNAEVEGEVVEKADAREFSKFGKAGKVANAVLQDDSGKVKLSLWDEQVDQVSVGDLIRIKNGYVSEWQGEKQLSTGRMGTLEVVRGSPSSKSDNPPVQADEEKLDEEDIDY